MALNLDVSKLTQSAAMKATPHDNCIVLDLGTGPFPRDIEVRLPDDDGARQNALWDGSLNLSVNDEVICFEYSGISAWRIMGMGGNDGGAGKVRVSEVWENDFGAVALQADATGQIGIGTSGPDARLDVLDASGAQLRLTFEDGVKFADFTVDTNHDLTIDPSSTGQIKLDATVTVIDEIQHEGDADNKIGFTDDVQTFTVGGEVLLTLTEAGQDVVKIGDGGDVDINFNDDMFLEGSTGSFGVGTSSIGAGIKMDVRAVGDHTRLGIGDPTADKFAQFTFKNLAGDWTVLSANAASGNSLQFQRGVTPVLVALPTTGFVGLNGITNPSTELDIGAGAIEGEEMTAPGAGASNTYRLYAEDNGAGKTRLMVIFATGAAQQITIEP